jgi:hypothetical protein
MKLYVLADQSGEILATHYTAASPPPGPARPSANSSSRIEPSEGQSLHEVELPAELERHVLENTFVAEIFKYRLERHGEVMRLVKFS